MANIFFYYFPRTLSPLNPRPLGPSTPRTLDPSDPRPLEPLISKEAR